MAELTDEQRIARIDKLLMQISPLNYEKILCKTSIYFLKENISKKYDETKNEEILKKQQELDIINKDLNPLFLELRQLQVLYFVEYKAEFLLSNEQTEWRTQYEYLYLKTDCTIDTMTPNGWTPYLNGQIVNQLLIEIYQLIFQKGFFNFEILNVKRQ